MRAIPGAESPAAYAGAGGRPPCSLPPAPQLGHARAPGGKQARREPERRRLQLRGGDALRAGGGRRRSWAKAAQAGVQPGGGGDNSFGGSRVLGVEDEAGCKRDSGLRGSRVRVFFQDTPLYF